MMDSYRTLLRLWLRSVSSGRHAQARIILRAAILIGERKEGAPAKDTPSASDGPTE